MLCIEVQGQPGQARLHPVHWELPTHIRVNPGEVVGTVVFLHPRPDIPLPNGRLQTDVWCFDARNGEFLGRTHFSGQEARMPGRYPGPAPVYDGGAPLGVGLTLIKEERRPPRAIER